MNTRHIRAMTACLALGLLGQASAQGQQAGLPAGGQDGREAIEAQFKSDLARIEGVKIAKLGQLAATQPKAEAAKTLDYLFQFAISTGLYDTAEPMAEKVLAAGDMPIETTLLAHMVNLVAEANRGAFDESLANLARVIQIRQQEVKGEEKAKLNQALPLAARLSLVNVYTQRLIYAGRYDIALKALTMIRDTTKEPEIKNLVTGRLRQVELVGKPAPEIVGKDLDGKPVKLGDLKGEVVLVIFWASWFAPITREAAEFDRLAQSYGDKGFKVIGINLDTLQEGGLPAASVLPSVRRFIVDHNISFPNLINGTGDQDYAKAYGATQLPCDVLIGRDGKVIGLDLNATNVEKAILPLLSR